MTAAAAQEVRMINLQVGEACRFVDAWTLVELGYVQEFLSYAETEWKVLSIMPAWSPERCGRVKNYFDLINDKEIIISAIADEVLVKV